MPRRYIRLHTVEPCVLTADEYAAAEKELIARHLADDVTVVDRIVARLLVEHRSRYNEIKDDVDADEVDEIPR